MRQNYALSIATLASLTACHSRTVQTIPSDLLPESKAPVQQTELPVLRFEDKFSYVLDKGYTQGNKSDDYRTSQFQFELGDTYVNTIIKDLDNDLIPDLQFIITRKSSNERVFFVDYDKRSPTQDHPDVIKRYLNTTYKKVDLTTVEGKQFVIDAQKCYIEVVDAAFQYLHGQQPKPTEAFIENYTKIILPPVDTSANTSTNTGVPQNQAPQPVETTPILPAPEQFNP